MYRKIRSDVLSERERIFVFEFWASFGNFCFIGNKSDVKRKYLGFNEYIEYEK